MRGVVSAEGMAIVGAGEVSGSHQSPSFSGEEHLSVCVLPGMLPGAGSGGCSRAADLGKFFYSLLCPTLNSAEVAAVLLPPSGTAGRGAKKRTIKTTKAWKVPMEKAGDGAFPAGWAQPPAARGAWMGWRGPGARFAPSGASAAGFGVGDDLARSRSVKFPSAGTVFSRGSFQLSIDLLRAERSGEKIHL